MSIYVQCANYVQLATCQSIINHLHNFVITVNVMYVVEPIMTKPWVFTPRQLVVNKCSLVTQSQVGCLSPIYQLNFLKTGVGVRGR